MRSTPARPRTRCRALLVVGAVASIAPGCSYLELAGRNVGESIGLVEPPPEHRTGGDPISTPTPVTRSPASR